MSLTDPFFDADFLHFMEARYDASRNAREVDLIWRLADLQAGDRVVDLACGWGRIAHALATRGADVLGLDVNTVLIDAAKALIDPADVSESSIDFNVDDMRSFTLDKPADTVILWWSSFGFHDDATDKAVLARIHRSLRPGGKLVLEHVNGAMLLHEAFSSPRGVTSYLRQGDDLMIDTRSLIEDGRRVSITRLISRAGKLREVDLTIRLFTAPVLTDWLTDAGFKNIRLYDHTGAAMTPTSYHMVAIAEA